MATTNGSSETGTTSFPGQDWTVPLWLDGKQVTTEHTFDLVAPATGNTLYKTSSANVNDCNAAVAAAEKAFPAWSKTKPSFRRELLLKAADELVRRREELWQFANKEVASTENYFAFDFNDAVESLRSTAGLIGGAAQGFLPDILSEDRSAMVVKEPFGVVLAIAPWNCPCILGLRSFLGPLASMFLCKSRTDHDHPLRTDMLASQWGTRSSSRHLKRAPAACGLWSTSSTRLVCRRAASTPSHITRETGLRLSPRS